MPVRKMTALEAELMERALTAEKQRDALAETVHTLMAECRECEQHRGDLAEALTEVLADVDALLGNEPDMRMDSAIAASLRVGAQRAHEALAGLEEGSE